MPTVPSTVEKMATFTKCQVGSVVVIVVLTTTRTMLVIVALPTVSARRRAIKERLT